MNIFNTLIAILFCMFYALCCVPRGVLNHKHVRTHTITACYLMHACMIWAVYRVIGTCVHI